MVVVDYAALNVESIKVTLDEAVLIIVLDRAKQRNSYGGTLPTELIEMFTFADRDDRVRVVVVTAEPDAPAYCSGADISSGWSQLFKPEDEAEGETGALPWTHRINAIDVVVAHRDTGGKLSMAVYNCRKITIAAVNGHAAGVGMTAMQLPFDLRFVWEGAKLVFPFVRRGINAEATSSYLLPRLLGHSRANSLLLTGAVVSPTSPLISSLYHEIIPRREDVFPAALKLAKDLASNTSQISIAYTKGLLQHPGDTIEDNHILDSRAIRLTGSSADAAEGAVAFKEKRPPRFPDTLSKNSSPWYPWWKLVDVRHRKAKL
ncbi:peroxisomal enoyl-CoA-hydratase [Lentinula raphanica]|uniref:Peroxisomal enoyl-CoA-hydratase n=1 Tax=Lentinula raphanica TaxID=153919 RepID=A0AA38UN24_9AGAR|nr:peroxisomal enoyl-CoA-hydratase [Lentinula raphanica]KAJ3974489.1 peroxisomal enoyl-CoA-hydratase [Lentinula raphanica]